MSSEADYILQAEFLLTRGYVSGMTISQLADKLLDAANKEKPVPEGIHTRDNVYNDDVAKEFVKNKRDSASDTQKRLIMPGERQSAAISPYESPLEDLLKWLLAV